MENKAWRPEKSRKTSANRKVEVRQGRSKKSNRGREETEIENG